MIVILGGGLAGLSTALHLGHERHLVIEGQAEPGGLCRTRDVSGFLFDYTGHLLHVRDPRAIRLVDELLPGAFDVVARDARVRLRGVTVPFPFQANLHGLPKDLVADCIVDLAQVAGVPVPDDPRTSFEAWALAVFGRGISDLFMLPYNRKLFCRPPQDMTADWVSWAVPRPSLTETVRGALGIENSGMGYNSTFRYPREGGIGILPRALADRVRHIRSGQAAVEVDLERRRVTLAGGDVLSYDRLVVTTPLPQLLRMTRGGPAGLAALADDLDWSVVACLNLGVNRSEIAGGAHWIYFPDADVPFYRVGFPSNFSKTVSPPGTSSMYVEFGLARDAPLDRAALEAAALVALRREGILREDDRLLARDWIRIDPGYVIFDRARQDVMLRVVPDLAQYGVHLIGRYGAWTYSYMERALLDGLELAGTLLHGASATGS